MTSQLRRLLALCAVSGCALGVAWLVHARGRAKLGANARADTLEAEAIGAARARLHGYEEARRRVADFAAIPPAGESHGADPYALARLDAAHLVGVLRGGSKLVVLDRSLRELARAPAPLSTVSVVVLSGGEIALAGEDSSRIQRYRFERGALVRLADWLVPGVLGLRALERGPGDALYALDERAGQLLTLRPRGEHEQVDVVRRFVGQRPIALQRVGDALIVNALLDHALLVYALDERGDVIAERTRIVHDGPIWGFDARADGSELVIAAGGVEDHPLDRRDGAFGFIDSFAFTYVVPRAGAPRRAREDNLSALGIVTPKALSLSLEPNGRASLLVSGYGSAGGATLSFSLDGAGAPELRRFALPPGAQQAVPLGGDAWAFADPLLDAWVLRDPSADSPKIVPVHDEAAPEASSEERLGEALFFTTLMAPRNSSDGRASRFSCETCHFEGEIDGRIHHTGRADVRVVTKPLRGLFNNRPHFSRAFDRDLTTVVFNEFRVAGKGSGSDPWFAVRRQEFPWLAELGVADSEVGPEALRHALLAFLMGFSHPRNSATVGRSTFEPVERRGAELFRDKCASCHAARLSTDDAASAVPFERWEALLFGASQPLVWASAEYQKTGVLPYVCELGTRTPSLRRAYRKWPHFTDGSAKTLADVLARARFDATRFFHEVTPADGELQALTEDEQRALAAFLELL